MEHRTDSVRERLLAALPQPEDLAAYREETAALLEKHEKALSWEKRNGRVLSLIGLIMCVILVVSDPTWPWGPKLHTNAGIVLRISMAVFIFMMAGLADLKEFVYRKQVSLLKEVKQVQLQILELQASLRKDPAP